jgi:carboxypeptidase Q
MNNRSFRRVVAIGILVAATSVAAETGGDARQEAEMAVLSRIRSTAMASNWAWEELETLTDSIGPRLSGSPGLDASIHQLAGEMRALGAQVTLQPAKVHHWIRGEEHAELVDYAGRPQDVTQNLRLTALGTSSSTEAGGLVARVVVVRDLDELRARAAEVRGAIVLFDSRFDQRLADNGLAGRAYGQAVTYRNSGPSEAASLGAGAVLVRSVGGADFRLVHTGTTSWKDGRTPIPAAALSSEDADLVVRLAARGPVTMKLILGGRNMEDADSFNVIADWPGAELPNEIVVVSGHLDSWDLGTGATDDGVGVVAAAGVVQVLHQLNLHARRTIRFIAWTDEEMGSRGAQAYFDSLGTAVGMHCAAIEDDSGAGRALGFNAAVPKEALHSLKAVTAALAPIGATVLQRVDGGLGADIGPLQVAGTPAFSPLVDTRHYFDYHHTAADTLDKVDPVNLQSQVAAMSVLTYFLANRSECFPRFAISAEP